MYTMSFHICMFLSHFPYQNTFPYPKMGTSSSDMIFLIPPPGGRD